MKNFTLRQVRGNATAELDACEREGRVRLTRKNGKNHIVKPIGRRSLFVK